jgi:NADPH:quinone reductase-like Zn-dependent oxidoreductase
MRAAVAEEFGGIDSVRLGELPEPAAGPGQVLARHARGKIVLEIGQ